MSSGNGSSSSIKSSTDSELAAAVSSGNGSSSAIKSSSDSELSGESGSGSVGR